MSLQLMRQATRASALLACLLIGACASGARDRAQLAERAEDFDRAVAEYTRALQERPDDPSLRRDLERAKLRAAQQHYAEGRRHAGLGNYDEALVEYQIAAEMNPLSGEIQDAVAGLRG